MGRWVNIMTTVSSDGSLGLVSTIGMVELSSLLLGGWSDFGQVIFSTQITERERERERERRKKEKGKRDTLPRTPGIKFIKTI